MAKNSQLDDFKKAAREAGPDMIKEEFVRAIGGLSQPQAPAKDVDEDRASDSRPHRLVVQTN